MSKTPLKKFAHYLNWDERLKTFRKFRKDNSGGFLIPSSSKAIDLDFERYRHLPVNWSVAPITKDDLHDEFSPRAVKTVDMFRRKTVDLPYECMIYFDYVTGSIVSCNFSNNNTPDEVQGRIYRYLLKKMNIASIHNHPIQYGSPPSGKNFEMLGFDFEEFELISSKNELWILESRERVFSAEEINEIRRTANNYFDLVYDEVNLEFEKGYMVMDNLEKVYGDLLLDYLNNNFENVKLTRRYLSD